MNDLLKQAISFQKNLNDANPRILFHEKHANRLSHPADIYSNAIKKLIDTHTKIFEQKDIEKISYIHDIGYIKDYINSIDEFYDELALIIKCFTPPNKHENQNSIIFLEDSKSTVYAKLKDSTKSHHDDFRKMSNALKHNGAKICTFKIENHTGAHVNGFYIEEAIGDNDQKGPSPKIHKLYKETVQTGFSFNHILLRSIGHLLNCSHRLNKLIFNATKVPSLSPEKLLKFLDIASTIKYDFFPDEYHRVFSYIRKNNGKFEMIYPFRYKNKKENFHMIENALIPVEINQRTGHASSITPYMPLITSKKFS